MFFFWSRAWEKNFEKSEKRNRASDFPIRLSGVLPQSHRDSMVKKAITKFMYGTRSAYH